MKHILRAFEYILIVAISFSIFVGCTKETMQPMGEISDFDSEKHFNIENILNNSDDPSEEPSETTSLPISEEQSREETSSVDNSMGGQSEASKASQDSTSQQQNQSTITGEFVVNEKKYDYKNANLMVLNIENKTNMNFNVTIKGQYLDTTGKTLKEETVAFEGFAAGWKNNFFFVPEIPFDKFTYTLQVEAYDGECLAQLFTPYWEVKESAYDSDTGYEKVMSELEEWHKGGEVGDPPNFDDMYSRGILLFYGFKYGDTPRDLTVFTRILVLSSQGEPVTHLDFSEWGASKWERGKGEDGITKLKPLYTFPDQDHLEWPEELKGELTVLFSITKVSDPLGTVEEE